MSSMFLFAIPSSSSPANTSDTSILLSLDTESFASPKPAPLPCCPHGSTVQPLSCLSEQSCYHPDSTLEQTYLPFSPHIIGSTSFMVTSLVMAAALVHAFILSLQEANECFPGPMVSFESKSLQNRVDFQNSIWSWHFPWPVGQWKLPVLFPTPTL